jgi:hypothetical protein
MAAKNCSVFKCPVPPETNHSKTGQVRNSDPHCGLVKTNKIFEFLPLLVCSQFDYQKGQ